MKDYKVYVPFRDCKRFLDKELFRSDLEFIEYIGVTPTTFYRWRKNDRVPLWVMKVLMLVDEKRYKNAYIEVLHEKITRLEKGQDG